MIIRCVREIMRYDYVLRESSETATERVYVHVLDGFLLASSAYNVGARCRSRNIKNV
jgi:hypothetical protein